MPEPPAEDPADVGRSDTSRSVIRRLSVVRIAPLLSGGTLGFRLRSRGGASAWPRGEGGCRQASVAWLVPLCFFTTLGSVGPITFLSAELIKHYGANASVMISAFLSVRGVVSVSISPWLGALSDRRGRQPVLVFKAVLVALWMVPLACLPEDFEPRVLASLVLLSSQGLSGSAFGTLFAYCGDVVLAGRAAGMNEAVAALLATSFTPAMICGSPIASLLHHYLGSTGMWRGLLAACTLNILYAMLLPESLAEGDGSGSPVSSPASLRRQASGPLSLNPFASFRLLTPSSPAGPLVAAVLRRVVLILFLLYFAKWSLISIVPLYAQLALGWNAEKASMLISTWGVSQFCTFWVLTLLLRRARAAGAPGNERAVAWVGLIAGLVGISLLLSTYGGWLPFVAMSIGAVSMVTYTALTSYATSVVDPTYAGETQGLVSVTLDMAEVAGPPVFGTLLRWGVLHREEVAWLPNLSFAVGALSVLCSMAVMSILPAPEVAQEQSGSRAIRLTADT